MLFTGPSNVASLHSKLVVSFDVKTCGILFFVTSLLAFLTFDYVTLQLTLACCNASCFPLLSYSVLSADQRQKFILWKSFSCQIQHL